MVFWIQS